MSRTGIQVRAGNPNDSDLYAGLSGTRLIPEDFDLGCGVLVSQTYAHFMAPFLMAFAPAAAGKPHPAPWKAVSDGLAIDITAQLHVPRTCQLQHVDRLNTIWWIAALFRLRAGTALSVPVISNTSFCAISTGDEEPQLWPTEIYTQRLYPDGIHHVDIGISELEWVRRHWLAGSTLLKNEDFNLAFQAVDAVSRNLNTGIALVSLWGALERLFCNSHQELRFRTSANIASFLKPPGRERYECFKQITKLYDHRSKAAHGGAPSDSEALKKSYDIARRVLLKVVEKMHIPEKKELEASLFGEDCMDDQVSINASSTAAQKD